MKTVQTSGSRPAERKSSATSRMLLRSDGWIGVVGRQRVKVGDEEVAIVLVLELDPVVERAHVVAKVKAAGGSHAAQDAGT